MLVIFIMILCGAVLLRRGILSSASAKAMSYLVAHVCNPALLLSSAFAYEGKLPLTVFFRGLLVAIGFHAILIAGGFLINTVLRVKREERYSYQLLTAFGNIGFIGIPVCRAVLGPESLVYVSVSCLVFGILFYTYGTATIQNAAQLQHAAQRTGSAGMLSWIGSSKTVVRPESPSSVTSQSSPSFRWSRQGQRSSSLKRSPPSAQSAGSAQ